MKYLYTLGLLGLLGCPQGKDSEDTGEAEETGDTEETDTVDSDTDTGEGTVVDSCMVTDWDICYEYVDYALTETWCSDLATEYTITTAYSTEGCASGAVAACLLPIGGDFDAESTAYYYDTFTETDAEGACTAGGGTVL